MEQGVKINQEATLNNLAELLVSLDETIFKTRNIIVDKVYATMAMDYVLSFKITNNITEQDAEIFIGSIDQNQINDQRLFALADFDDDEDKEDVSDEEFKAYLVRIFKSAGYNFLIRQSQSIYKPKTLEQIVNRFVDKKIVSFLGVLV